jgi:serine protease Do
MSSGTEIIMERKTLLRSTLALAVAAAVGGAYWAGQSRSTVAAPMQSSAASATPNTGLPVTASAMDFSGIVERFGPAVVNISVTGKARATSNEDDGPDFNDPFYEFFRRFAPQMPRQQQGQPVRGQGSGFIVASDGLILTNAHVVDGASEVTVKLTDRREFTAKVLGTDKQADIAVLRIDAKALPTVVIGNPDRIRVGESVLAIGSPYGFENTATSGIVSAKSRSLPDDNYVPFIQTDVAVNPGNSGGPLFNARGEVIGINSQIYSQTGGYQGLSFAIPINVATHIQEQLVKHGKVTRGRLGLTVQELDQALASSFGLKTPHGALINSVEPGSPAEKAGLQAGDIIVKLGNKVIEHSNDLPLLVADIAPGSKTTIEVIRKGSSKTMSVTVGEMKATKVSKTEPKPAQPSRLGVSVRGLSPDELASAGLQTGLLVEEVSGPAARAGVQEGDVILALNGNPIKSPDELRNQLKNAGKHVALLVWRDSVRIFIPVDLG